MMETSLQYYLQRTHFFMSIIIKLLPTKKFVCRYDGPGSGKSVERGTQRVSQKNLSKKKEIGYVLSNLDSSAFLIDTRL